MLGILGYRPTTLNVIVVKVLWILYAAVMKTLLETGYDTGKVYRGIVLWALYRDTPMIHR